MPGVRTANVLASLYRLAGGTHQCVRMARGDPAGALQAYTRAVDIFERLARADPDNTEHQRGLLISLRKFGFGAPVAAFSPPGKRFPGQDGIPPALVVNEVVRVAYRGIQPVSPT